MAEEMTFDADASKAWTELQKLQQQWRAVEQTLAKAASTSERSAQVASAALRLQQDNTRALVTQIDQLRAASDKQTAASTSMAKGFQAAGTMGQTAFGGLMTLLGGGGLLSTIQQIMAAQKEWSQRVLETSKNYDEVARNFRVQALQADPEFQKTLKTRLFPAAQKAGLSLTDTTEAATEMYSKGFDMPAILGDDKGEGSALTALLLGAQAAKYKGSKIAFANAIASYLKSSGQELNEENVTGVLAPLVTLFQKTGIEAGDLLEISQIGALSKSYQLKQSETFAAVGVVKDFAGKSASESVVGIRNVMQILGGAAAVKEKADTLRAIGGDQLLEQTDFVGENLGQVLENLGAALDGLGRTPEENLQQRHTALAKLFGMENVAIAEQLLAHRGKLEDYATRQQDTSQYAEGIKRGTEGEFVAANRRQNAKVMAELKTNETRGGRARMWEEYYIAAEEAGWSGWDAALYANFEALMHGFKWQLPADLEERLMARAEARMKPADAKVKLPKPEEVRGIKPAARGKGRAPIDFAKLSADATDADRTPEQIAVQQAEARLEQVEAEEAAAAMGMRIGGELPASAQRQLRDRFGARKEALRVAAKQARLANTTAELGKTEGRQAAALANAQLAATQPSSPGGAAVTPGEQQIIELARKQHEATVALLEEMRRNRPVKPPINVGAHKE